MVEGENLQLVLHACHVILSPQTYHMITWHDLSRQQLCMRCFTEFRVVSLFYKLGQPRHAQKTQVAHMKQVSLSVEVWNEGDFRQEKIRKGKGEAALAHLLVRPKEAGVSLGSVQGRS